MLWNCFYLLVLPLSCVVFPSKLLWNHPLDYDVVDESLQTPHSGTQYKCRVRWRLGFRWRRRTFYSCYRRDETWQERCTSGVSIIQLNPWILFGKILPKNFSIHKYSAHFIALKSLVFSGRQLFIVSRVQHRSFILYSFANFWVTSSEDMWCLLKEVWRKGFFQ